jgi:hypothetical protein
VQNAQEKVPALALTRALFLLVLILMLGAMVFAGWVAVEHLGSIGV